MLHRLWGKAQGHPDYDKREWMELARQFDGLLAACKLALCYMEHGSEPRPGYGAARQNDMAILRKAIAQAAGEES